MRGKISLALQEPWLIHGTIKENITYGQDYDEVRYQSVIECTCLSEDLLQMPNHDNTVIAENGETLSGGQKKRINLARALYQMADIYLLDDIFSNLDESVKEHILREGILKFLS